MAFESCPWEERKEAACRKAGKQLSSTDDSRKEKFDQMSGPNRIVCLTEETTEMLYLLGEEDRIVGISAYTVRPERARQEKPVVSAFVNGSVPKIKALAPDLVIGFSDIQSELARALIAEGLTVLVTHQRSLSEVHVAMNLLGDIVGRGSRARELTSAWQNRLTAVREARALLPSPRVFFQEWDEPCITGIRWVSELLETAGATDVFSELAGAPLAGGRIVPVTEVVARSPDIILGSWCGKPMDRSWVEDNFRGTPAVSCNAVFEIEAAVILQPGPALFGDGLDSLVECLDRGMARRSA